MRDRLRLQDEDPLPASHKRTATLGQGKVYYTTLLREPVARVLSEWCFLLHSSSNTPLSGWSAWNDGLRADRPNIPRIPSDSPCTNNTALVPQPARCELYMPRTVSGEKFSCESFLSGISKVVTCLVENLRSRNICSPLARYFCSVVTCRLSSHHMQARIQVIAQALKMGTRLSNFGCSEEQVLSKHITSCSS